MYTRCRVCGRQIMRGRRYCSEHRYFADGLSSMGRLNKSYLNYCMKPFRIGGAISGLIFLFGSVILFGIKGNILYFLLGMGLLMLFAFIWVKILKYFIQSFFVNDINKKKERYVKFARIYGESVKREKDFRDSIFE